jgi:hypothetical protein
MRITKNNWYNDNLEKKLKEPNKDFEVYLTPYPFCKMDFWSSVELTVNEISKDYPNPYLALSGGYDSEFVLRAFYKFGKSITPVIVRYGNDEETFYAYKACKDLGITPIEIHLSDKQYLDYYYNTIFKPFNSPYIHCVHVHAAADYVAKRNGSMITGFGPIGTFDNPITEDFSSIPEWENYASFIYPNVKKIDFFYYTVELAYAQFPTSDEGRWPEIKSKLFELEYRQKARPKYLPHINAKLQEIAGHLKSYKFARMIEYSRQEWEDIFSGYIIDTK